MPHPDITTLRARVVSRRTALGLIGAAALMPVSGCATTSPPRFAPLPPDVHYLTISELSRLIASGTLSPVALTERLLDRIAALDASLKSYATVTRDAALAAARAAEVEIAGGKIRGPLHGVPIAVKDLCHTRGIRTMGGCGVRKDFVPTDDATVVSKLRDAGAVLLGKLNTTEGATLGYNPELDVPRNPWNPDRWPGASSSGSGVATAAGLCFAAIGTDTGGSIRFPASANGIVGLKPTYGRVSRHAVMTMSDTLDHVGPMARSVADAAIMLDAIAGRDPADSTSADMPAPGAFASLTSSIKGMRIGIDRTYALAGLDSEHTAAIEAALLVLRDAGAEIVDVKMPPTSTLVMSWMPICVTEMRAAHASTFPSRAAEYGPYTREFLSAGDTFTPATLTAARAGREAFTAEFVKLLASVDAMVSPSGGDPAWPITRDLQVGSLQPIHAAWALASPRAAEFTMPMNLAGVPSICLPSGFTKDGLPYSIQFTGRRWSESTLCRIGYAYEQATEWHRRHPVIEAN